MGQNRLANLPMCIERDQMNKIDMKQILNKFAITNCI